METSLHLECRQRDVSDGLRSTWKLLVGVSLPLERRRIYILNSANELSQMNAETIEMFLLTRFQRVYWRSIAVAKRLENTVLLHSGINRVAQQECRLLLRGHFGTFLLTWFQRFCGRLSQLQRNVHNCGDVLLHCAFGFVRLRRNSLFQRVGSIVSPARFSSACARSPGKFHVDVILKISHPRDHSALRRRKGSGGGGKGRREYELLHLKVSEELYSKFEEFLVSFFFFFFHFFIFFIFSFFFIFFIFFIFLILSFFIFSLFQFFHFLHFSSFFFSLSFSFLGCSKSVFFFALIASRFLVPFLFFFLKKHIFWGRLGRYLLETSFPFFLLSIYICILLLFKKLSSFFSFSIIFFHFLSFSFIFFHFLPFSFMLFHFLSFSFIFFHFLSFSFIFFHFLSFSFMFFHFLSFSFIFFFFVGCSKSVFFFWHQISGCTPLGPLFLFFPPFFQQLFCLFSCFFSFSPFFHFLFSFFPKKKCLLFFFLVFLSNIFYCWH